jgi:hypothetical protein
MKSTCPLPLKGLIEMIKIIWISINKKFIKIFRQLFSQNIIYNSPLGVGGFLSQTWKERA